MMFIGAKIYQLPVIYVLYSLWLLMFLDGCSLTSKNIPSESARIDGDVTLLWNEIPSASAYNIYVSESPGVTKRSGYKIPNVTNPFRINRLEPGKTYYFIVTAVSGSGESEGSKELSYYTVADKIGLIYWKNLFNKSIHDHKSSTAETGQEIKITPERTITEPARAPIESITLGGKIVGGEKSASDLVKVNLQSSKERVAEAADIEEDLSEKNKPATAPTKTGTDQKLRGLEEARLKSAQMLFGSDFYIFFDQNSNELSPKALEKLNRIYEILVINSDAKLRLNGYSDSSGAPSNNHMVSEVRANSVKVYLSDRGIRPSRMTALGHGTKKSLASNKTAEGRRLNRRVEIELIIP